MNESLNLGSQESASGLINSIIIPVILSVPNPSLAARLEGHILSIIWPRIPQSPPIYIPPLVGDLVGDPDPCFPNFFVAGPVTLFLPAEEPLEVDVVYLRVGDYPD